ncbi:hypothetical protein VPHD69_0114 [Vibrio phage D69]
MKLSREIISDIFNILPALHGKSVTLLGNNELLVNVHKRLQITYRTGMNAGVYMKFDDCAVQLEADDNRAFARWFSKNLDNLHDMAVEHVSKELSSTASWYQCNMKTGKLDIEEWGLA